MQIFTGWRRNLLLAVVALLLCATTSFAQRRGGRGGGADAFSYRWVGPAVGNRVSAITGIPGDPSTYYAGGASGGVWKSTDGGNDWNPVFDAEPVQAIGALALDPNAHDTVWAEPEKRGPFATLMLWAMAFTKPLMAARPGRIWVSKNPAASGASIVNPKNGDEVFVCALGRLTGPQQERGVYRTLDGGKNWERVLFVDEKTGCSGLSLDPENTHTLVRGLVASGDAHLRRVERRPRKRRVRLARQWNNVVAHRRPRHAAFAGRKN